MEIIDNVNKTLRDDLKYEIKNGSKLSIAAACFSIYAYQELKEELENIDEFKFIFTSPTFVTESTNAKERREYYIPKLYREKSIYGTEFEVKLRNELSQKAIARECADWIRRKARFKSNITNDNIQGFIVSNDNSYLPISDFSTIQLGCERGNQMIPAIVKSTNAENSRYYIEQFEEIWQDPTRLKDVTEQVINNISTAYKENSPEFIYYITLYNIFSEFLDDISEDTLPNEAVGFKETVVWNKLYNFQKDAALAIINKLEKYNGCILADSVGLGKTFTALSVIKYYESRNQRVLVLCPKKLAENWNTYKDNYVNNILAADRLNYDVLFHTDLSRKYGMSNGIDLARINWANYDLVVIDESHNFRNGGKLSGEDNEKENRYLRLLNHVIRKGVKTKVLMLSATPVNNRFNDLRNQLQLAYEGNPELINDKLNTKKSIDEVFKSSQKAFNIWNKLPAEERTTESLLKKLDNDFFEVLDAVTIARSRKHIENYYDTTDIGTFPTRLKPITIRPDLTDLGKAITYNEIFEQITNLNLYIYNPTKFIQPSRMSKYADLYDDKEVKSFTQDNREKGIRRLMAINLMKRMESSVHSFNLTLGRIRDLIEDTIDKIRHYDAQSKTQLDLFDVSRMNEDEWDADDQNGDDFTFGKKVKIDLADMDRETWRTELERDLETLNLLILMVSDITPEHDTKLQTLLSKMKEKIEHPINANNKKIIIFTAFADTADYLYDNVSQYIKQQFGLDTAIVTGTQDGKTTAQLHRKDMNTILTCFSPLSKERELVMPQERATIDVLIATDCISEGQNLQDCDYLINYDIHWNPVRIIQRFGRIDRIGSKNSQIQLVNFWPNVTLDQYIDLKARVETRMKIVDMTATGDDNVLSDAEQADLEYRKAQLQKLQEEVVDIEDVSSGISIMDLGLNEFRLDLLEYSKQHPELEKIPLGLNSVVCAEKGVEPGVVFVLKNRNNNVNTDSQNRLHPFYMVYISNDGNVLCDHLSPKKLLDSMRLLCKGKNIPLEKAYIPYNKETKDGKDMRKISELLEKSVKSIIDIKEENDVISLFKRGGTALLNESFKGLDDFELVSFLVVR